MPKTHLRNHRKQNLPVLLLELQLCALTAVGQNLLSIKLNVDASDAATNVLRTTLTIPVKPGPLTLFYPKWIPGEHSPTGPINDLVGLKITANGKSIPWALIQKAIQTAITAKQIRFASESNIPMPCTTSNAQLIKLEKINYVFKLIA